MSSSASFSSPNLASSSPPATSQPASNSSNVQNNSPVAQSFALPIGERLPMYDIVTVYAKGGGSIPGGCFWNSLEIPPDSTAVEDGEQERVNASTLVQHDIQVESSDIASSNVATAQAITESEKRAGKENQALNSFIATTGATQGTEKDTTANISSEQSSQPLSAANSINMPVKHLNHSVLKRKADSVGTSEFISAPRQAKRPRNRVVAPPTSRVTRGSRAQVECTNDKIGSDQQEKLDTIPSVDEVKAMANTAADIAETTKTTKSNIKTMGKATVPSGSEGIVANISKSAPKITEKKGAATDATPKDAKLRIIIPLAAVLAAKKSSTVVQSAESTTTTGAPGATTGEKKHKKKTTHKKRTKRGEVVV